MHTNIGKVGRTRAAKARKAATVRLLDGYNGHTCLFYVDPIERDGNLIKLRVVGSTYLFAWKRVEDVQKVITIEQLRAEYNS